MVLRPFTSAVAASAVLLAVVVTTRAGGDSRRLIPSAFFISKNQNKNQVHYAIDVDGACSPLGAAPVRAYWRMLEESRERTEPLLPRERPAYDIAWQRVVRSSNGEPVIELALRGLPSRPLSVRTRASSAGCVPETWMTVDHSTARLTQIHVKFGLFGVDSITLLGYAPERGLVREELKE